MEERCPYHRGPTLLFICCCFLSFPFSGNILSPRVHVRWQEHVMTLTLALFPLFSNQDNFVFQCNIIVQTFGLKQKLLFRHFGLKQKKIVLKQDVCSDIFVLRVYSILCFNATLLFKHITHLLLQTFWVRKEAFCSDIIFCLIGSTAEEAWKNLKRMSNVWIILGCQETLHACKHFDSKVFGMLTVEILHQKRKK